MREVARADRLGESGDVDAVDEGLQLGPTGIAVGAGEDALRVVEREARGVGVVLEAMDLGGSGRIAGAVSVQQIAGLVLELFEIGLPRQAAGRRIGQDDLLICPVSA